jgi:tRNA(Ile)-lysidine synthase
VAGGLRIGGRHGGERIRPSGHAHHRSLKKLLQERGVFPWMRDRLPLLFAGEELVAVADMWIAEACTASPGFVIRWERRPEIA